MNQRHPLVRKLLYLFRRVERRIKPLWTHWLSGGIIWAVPIGFLIWFSFQAPAPGMASVVCGGFVALMVLRNVTATHKFFCTLLVLALVGTEVKSIRIDRLTQDNEHLEAERKLQQEFTDTQKRIENVFDQNKTTLNTISGGDSYLSIEPILSVPLGELSAMELPDSQREDKGNGGQYFTLAVRNHGMYPINEIKIYANIDKPGAPNLQDISLPNSLPPLSSPTFACMCFIFDKNNAASSTFYIKTQNQRFTEILSVRRSKKNNTDLYQARYTIYNGIGINDKNRLTESNWTNEDN